MEQSEKIVVAFLLGYSNDVHEVKLTRDQFKSDWIVRYPSLSEICETSETETFYVCTMPLSEDEVYAVILDENKDYLAHRLASDVRTVN